MRVTTELWVSALVRRVFSDGGYAAIVQEGGASAGAIFIVSRDRLGNVKLFGPAPQSGYDEAQPEDRMFVELMATTDEAQIDARLARERRFDPDLWIVDIEPDERSRDLFPVMKPLD